MIYIVILAHVVVFFAFYLIWPMAVCLYYKDKGIKIETEEDLKVYTESLIDGYNFGVMAEKNLKEILRRTNTKSYF